VTGLRERNKSKRREAILDATVSLLRTREFGEITIEEVAALAEVAPSTVYNLVGPRDRLVYALMGRVVRGMSDVADLPTTPGDDPAEGLRMITDHGIAALTAEPKAHRALVRAVSSLPRWPGEARTPFVVYERAARQLEHAGALRPGLTYRLVARHAILGMYGSMTAWARGQSDRRFRDDAHLSLALVLASTTSGTALDRAQRDVDDLGRGAVLLR
jgi:AcrR family transcriptional regulator